MVQCVNMITLHPAIKKLYYYDFEYVDRIGKSTYKNKNSQLQSILYT